MQITREQEVALWKLMAESLDLTHEEDGIYIGKCPFCHRQNYFGIDTFNNYAGCSACKTETRSLAQLVDFLRTRVPVLDLG
jgi:hypothetical protein